MRLPSFIDQNTFISSIMEEIEWKNYSVQIGWLQSLWFLPDQTTPPNAPVSFFVSQDTAVKQWRIALLKGVWAICFDGDYIVDEVWPLISPYGQLCWFTVQRGAAHQIYSVDRVYFWVRWQVNKVSNWFDTDGNFWSEKQLLQGIRLYMRDQLNRLDI